MNDNGLLRRIEDRRRAAALAELEAILERSPHLRGLTSGAAWRRREAERALERGGRLEASSETQR